MTDDRLNLDPHGWFQSYQGKPVWPLMPRKEDIDIIDIARSLSLTNRFNGHLKFAYSVGQHSLIVSRNVPPEHALEALLHDASEVFLGDLIRPLKRAPEFAFFLYAEHKLETVIAEAFGLTFPWHPSIKEADNRALVTERRDVLNQPPHPWREESWKPYDERILEMDWREVERQFLVRFRQLSDERGVGHASPRHQ